MQVDNLLRNAEERARAKDFHGALRFLEQALALDPWCGAALLGMAEAYRGLQDDDNCLKAWERYLDEHPADARVLTRVGDLHRRRGMIGMALEYYLDALRVEPDNRHARATLAALGLANVELACGDGRLGWPEEAPFDAIVVSCAAGQIPPALWDQLAPGGRLLLPLEGHGFSQDLVLARKTPSGPELQSLLPVLFVPLR